MAVPSWFDAEYYIAAKAAKDGKESPAVTQADLDAAGFAGVDGAYRHYEEWGKAEGLAPSAALEGFNEDEYLAAKAAHDAEVSGGAPKTVEELKDELANAGMSAIDHYLAYNESEGTNYVPGEGEGGDKPGEGEGGEGEGSTPEVPGATEYLTVAQDIKTGTDGADTFIGYEFDGVNTLQSGDIIDGGAGTDTLYADLTAGSTYGHTLNAVTPIVKNMEVVKFNSRQSTSNNDGQAMAVVDAERIDSNMRELWNVDSRADLTVDDVRVDSNDMNVVMSNTDAHSNFEAFFNSQNLKAQDTVTSGTLYAELIDTVGALPVDDGGHGNPLWDNPYTGFHFKLDGQDYTLNFGEYNSKTVAEGTELSYEGLKAQMQSIIDNDPALSGLGLTVEVGDVFDATVGIGTHQGTIVEGKQIVVKAETGVLEGGNWVAANGLPSTNSTSATFNAGVDTTCPLIQTNVKLDNVGRVQWNEQSNCLPDESDFGGPGGYLVVGGMGETDGVERFDVTVDRGSWLSSLSSTNNTLRMVTVKAGDINGDGTIGNVEAEANNTTDQTGQLYIGTRVDGQVWADGVEPGGFPYTGTTQWFLKTSLLEGGLVDVKNFDAATSGFNGDLNIGAALTVDAYDKYMLDVDGANSIDSSYAPSGPFAYMLGGGDDVLNLTVNENLGADHDFDVDVDAGAGDDLINFAFTSVDDIAGVPGDWHWQSESTANIKVDGNLNGQMDLNNVEIKAGTGDDEVWFTGVYRVKKNGTKFPNIDGPGLAGAVTVYDGAGDDALYLGQGVGGNSNHLNLNNTIWTVNNGGGGHVFSDNYINGQPFGNFLVTDKATLDFNAPTVQGESLEVVMNFAGVEGSYKVALAAGTTSVQASTVNDAIIQAITGDKYLDKLLNVQDGSGETLVIESKVNGDYSQDGLTITLNKVDADGDIVDVTNLYGSVAVGNALTPNAANPLNGSNTGTISENTVHMGAGDDVIALNVASTADHHDTLVIEGAFGNDVVFGFNANADKINVAASLFSVAPAAVGAIEIGTLTAADTNNDGEISVAEMITNGVFTATTALGEKDVYFLQHDTTNTWSVVQVNNSFDAANIEASEVMILGSITFSEAGFAVTDAQIA